MTSLHVLLMECHTRLYYTIFSAAVQPHCHTVSSPSPSHMYPTQCCSGGIVLSSYNRLIPNNAIIFDNGIAEDTNVGDILPPDNSSSVAVIDCSTDNSTQPLTWTDGAGQTVPTSPNLTVYQTTSGSSAALHIDTTDTSTFTNGRYQCDGGMARVVNIYINQEGGEKE